MKVQASKVLVIGAPDGFNVALVVPAQGPTKAAPGHVAAAFQADGEKADVLLTAEEAVGIGMAIMQAGAFLQGGAPPMFTPDGQPVALGAPRVVAAPIAAKPGGLIQ